METHMLLYKCCITILITIFSETIIQLEGPNTPCCLVLTLVSQTRARLREQGRQTH